MLIREESGGEGTVRAGNEVALSCTARRAAVLDRTERDEIPAVPPSLHVMNWQYELAMCVHASSGVPACGVRTHLWRSGRHSTWSSVA